MKIESIRLKNFRMFRDVTIDKLPNCCFFVGANGTGKTSLFDLFGFLRDALTYNVKQTLAKRRGFNEVVSRETVGSIELELTFRNLQATSSLVSYLLIIDLIENRPLVKREVLKYWPKQDHSEPKPIIDFSLGTGKIIDDENTQQLTSPDILALRGIGQFQHFEIASELCHFIENWHISNIQLSEARKINQATGYDEHLSSSGDNLALFAQRMHNHYPKQYQEIMHQMAYRLPSISFVEPITTEDGRIFLNFHHSRFKQPFQSMQVSDGTIQLFAHLLQLYDPNPHPLLCVEEPEKLFYPHLLRELAEEFSLYAMNSEQVFVSTQSPDFLNGAQLNEIFWLNQQNGYSQIHRATDSQLLQNLVNDGELPGALWKQRLLEDANLP